MATYNHGHDGTYGDSNYRYGDGEKAPYEYQQTHSVSSPVTDAGKLSDPNDRHHSLQRGLSARQVSMIAIGGAIGTGLIIGTGTALKNAGPASILISYSIVGLIVYVVMAALGEMATWLPAAGGFVPYATRYVIVLTRDLGQVDPALGFAVGYTYWFKYIITTPNQLTAGALVIQYWCPPERVNPGVFIAIFLVAIIVFNYLGIRFFGELEFWLSSIKVLTILGLIILMIVLAAGGGPSHEATGFRYWHNPGAFAEYLAKGSLGKFLAVWSTMVTAVFAFLGTELIGVTVGEAQNPRRNVPRAIKLTFWRIVIFYIVSVFLLGLNVAYNDPLLTGATKKSNSAAASPFVVAIQIAGIKGLPGFLNACILIFVFSAANSDLYIASRTIHGLALKGQAPRFLATTDKRGVPVYGLALSALVCCIAFLNISTSSKLVFGYFVNLVSIFGLLSWITILVSHIYFVRARKAQGVPKSELRYTSPFGMWGSAIALFFCCLIALTKNFTVFFPSASYGRFDYKNFITGYLGIPLYLMQVNRSRKNTRARLTLRSMIAGWKLVKRTKGVTPLTADLYTGKDIIDADEQEWLAREAAEKASGRGPNVVYRHTLGYLF
ncbi:amino acid transporter [Friedmanniomyces endolithicus]|uniref:Amino acid transporter n=1 Tax=Friedmanniomyces endolithicus TaxID=329885 RepID=A0AAN6QVA3_9PEZI|nr:amino acid transporter [Friedmanniomyces endolithicus]KAK0798452.1 amino acid transporter [Friedmanniomyces endolithicus]KAK0804365.1 amino acid transporter [Friedmanniomyces endolithicus]KAK0811298.1 amino acid transporter [Friedmanniomyces endolithicus]KAK0845164.1 amino acid transporter [Friedmanniomyces endolithicus]